MNTDEVAEPNAFAMDATIAAFTKGEDWLDELNVYLWENRKFAEEFFAENIPAFKTVKAEATYLMWVDVSATGKTGDVFAEELRKRTGVYISGGSQYGKSGENFVRINLACPRSFLEKALECMKDRNLISEKDS